MGLAVVRAATNHTKPLTSSGAAAAVDRSATGRSVLAPAWPIPGYLLIADRGNDRLLLVNSARHVFWSYPASRAAPAMPFSFDDDAFFGPHSDRIISNQEDQNTIQVISFPGRRILWRYGHVNVRGSANGYMNSPDDAYLLPDGLVSVADASNCRVLFINRAHRVVRQYGTTGVCGHNPPGEFGAVNGATPLANGGTLVSEIAGSWVDDIGPNGRLRWAVQAPVSYPSDPQLLGPGRFLLTDYKRPGRAIIMSRTGRVLWRYGPSSGPGELDHPSLALPIGHGLIAINDDYRDRVVIVRVKTGRIIWQYGHTDVAGRGPGYLNTPDGLDLLTTAEAQRMPAVRALLASGHTSKRTVPAVASEQLALQVRQAGYRLPAPVERAVAVASEGGILIAGGLDASGSSTNRVFRLNPYSGRLTALGSLPEPFHDAAVGLIGNRLYIFGGGASESSSSVQAFDLASRHGAVVAHLPRPLSDLAATTIGTTIYLVGGYDDHSPRTEIYGTTDGTHFRLAGHLPQGIRYAAVAATNGKLVVAGGLVGGLPSSAVYVFDPGSGRVTRLGSLPTATAHASAVSVGGSIYVVGGIDASGATLSAATRISVKAGKIEPVAVAIPIADAAAVNTARVPFLIGGRRNGHAVTDIRVLSAH